MYPILFVDLLRQASYKNTILLGMMHKQMVFFAKKYSKSNRITLDKTQNIWDKDNIKVVKEHFLNKSKFIGYNIFFSKNLKNIKVTRYSCNNKYCGMDVTNFCKITKNILQYCMKSGHTKAVKYLLEKSKNISVTDNEVFFNCVEFGNAEMMKLLLCYGADIHSKKDIALDISARNGNIEIVKLLLNNNADVHMDNDIVLRNSSQKGRDKIVKLLLEHGANVNVNGDEALKWCIESIDEILQWNEDYEQHVMTMELLLKYGANKNGFMSNKIRKIKKRISLDIELQEMCIKSYER